MAAPMCGLAGDLDKFRITSLPDSVYYVPNFITEIEEKYLHDKVYDAPKPKWVQLARRRLQNWGGLPHPKGMVSEALPQWLKDISAKVASLGVFGEKLPNHVLVNEYKPGEGILPHEDGPLYYPVVTNITLNSSTVIDFYKPRKSTTCEVTADAKDTETNSHIGSLLLERRSLLITSGAMYTDYLHGIEGRTKDIIDDSIKNVDACSVKQGTVLQRETRVSLTIRVVPKVLRANVLQALFKK
ncbi:putative RNA/DNA demethylase ALKBH6 isoform X2 [Dermacentor variabilis]|uniref:putative RNA/DNA demethylase ALKBH6 isoform X2 n=1 Tax=Dermacentor variabilis TaxID=34621 RepID=UPI003F5C1976